jgi:hypothetical protein
MNDALMWSPVTNLFYLGDKLGYLDPYYKESDSDLTYFIARVMVMLILIPRKKVLVTTSNFFLSFPNCSSL